MASSQFLEDQQPDKLPANPTWHRFCMAALPRNLPPSNGDIVGAYHYIKHIKSLELGKKAPYKLVFEELVTQILETLTYCKLRPMCRYKWDFASYSFAYCSMYLLASGKKLKRPLLILI